MEIEIKAAGKSPITRAVTFFIICCGIFVLAQIF